MNITHIENGVIKTAKKIRLIVPIDGEKAVVYISKTEAKNLLEEYGLMGRNPKLYISLDSKIDKVTDATIQERRH